MADATVTVGANVDAVKEAANQAKKALRGMADEMMSAMGGAAKSVVSDLTNVVAAAGKVNFSAQHEQVKAFEAGSARMAVSMGRDFEQVRSSIEATGVSIARRPKDVLAWADAVGRMTYNFDGAVKSQEAFAGLAAETGRTVEDYRGLGVELGKIGISGADTSKVIGNIAAQSEMLKNAGGVAALADNFEALGDSVTMFADKSTTGIGKVVGLLGTLGQGLDATSARRVGQQAIGTLTSDPRRWERYLGRHILDEHGEIKDPAGTMADIYAKVAKQYKNPEQRRNVLYNNFGQAGLQMEYAANHGGFGNFTAMAGLQSSKPTDALKAWLGGDAGQRDKSAAALEVSSRQLLGSSTALGKAADRLQAFAANNPLSSTALTSFGAALTGSMTTAIGGGIAAAVKAVQAQKTVGAALDVASKAPAGNTLGALGIGAGILGLGLWGIDKFEEAGHARLDAIEAAGVSEQAHRDRVRKGAAAQRAAYLEQTLGMSHGAAVFASQHENDRSFPVQRAQAIDATFQAQLAKAIQDGLSKAKIDVKTRQDTPVEVSVAGGGQAHAGGQHGG